ncbi:ABC-2 transporter permease [Paenibacillus etheri]|uniref:Uncharacterized protein n=1 Tax=Paenibacillus etheri TaxID=1306852 RepID=A0A0W1AZC7_9BACL|nr:hypothetical protein UQ64_14125 [Paenibacillus etheri]
MSNLYLLIRKDIILLRNFMPLFLLSFLFVAYVQMDSFNMFAAFQVLLLLVYSCSIDIQNLYRKFVIGLPVSRQEVVLAKYLSLIPYSFIGLGCSFVLCLISGLSGSSLTNSSLFLTITHTKLMDHLVQIGLIGIVYLFILYFSYKISLRLFSREEL